MAPDASHPHRGRALFPARARPVAMAFGALVASCALALAAPQNKEEARAPGGGETIDQALCRLIERSATTHGLAVEFLTRLIWQESSFRPGATSPVGAQGVAQFMPGTAAERGLMDPFDPEQAIPKAAEFLADLKRSFGNWGLAAAAYNGGPTRVVNWLDGRGSLPAETRAYVAIITGRSAEDWAADARVPANSKDETAPARKEGSRTCLELTALLRRPGFEPPGTRTVFAPWGVQLAGNFSKAQALASYSRARQSFRAIIGDIPPMVIGTRLRSRGIKAFYRVRVPADTRTAANTLCNRIRAAGGACVVLRS
jgi:hypothetical protein